MNAREAADALGQELEFLNVAATYQDELDAAKQALQAARDGGDAADLAGAGQRMDAARNSMRDFRHWARSTGNPRNPGPGSAVIKIGG